MKSMGSIAKPAPGGAHGVYGAFRKLDSKRRRDLALRILRDEGLLADLYDHLLIKRSMDEPGPSIAWTRDLIDQLPGE